MLLHAGFFLQDRERIRWELAGCCDPMMTLLSRILKFFSLAFGKVLWVHTA